MIGRWLGAALLAMLGGCAGIPGQQPGHEAVIRVGTEVKTVQDARPLAPYFLDYALLSLTAYDDRLYRAQQTYSRDNIGDPIVDEDGAVDRSLSDPYWRWVNRWKQIDTRFNACSDPAHARLDFGYDGRPGRCGENDSPRGRILEGLGLLVWRSPPERGVCREIVLAFRGTDARQLDDWLTNLRWIIAVPQYDQYAQVRDHIAAIVAQAKRQPCYREGQTRFVATGHSLGGGLAQQAAYAHPEIKRVYAFDPSPVTGFHSVPDAAARRHAEGLKIDRVYEHGEILAFVRAFFRQLYPLTNCDPQIRHVRFNHIYGGTIFGVQHSLVQLSRGLLRDAGMGTIPPSLPQAEPLLPPAPPAGPGGECLYPPPHSTVLGGGADGSRPIFVISYRRD